MASKASRVKDGSGATFPSPNAGEWPAWWFDAVNHMEVMHAMYQDARYRAEEKAAEQARKNR